MQTFELGMVLVKRGRQAFIPARLIQINDKYAIIKPMGHRRSEKVPITSLKQWKSRKETHTHTKS